MVIVHLMKQPSSSIYTVYLSKKTNNVDVKYNNSRNRIHLKKFYRLFTSINKILLNYLFLLISSDVLFRRSLLLINLIIQSFPVRHNREIIRLGFLRIFGTVEYLMEKLMFLCFNCQICFVLLLRAILVLFMFKVPSMVSVPFVKGSVC